LLLFAFQQVFAQHLRKLFVCDGFFAQGPVLRHNFPPFDEKIVEIY